MKTKTRPPRINYEAPPVEVTAEAATRYVKELRQRRQRDYHETGAAEIVAYERLQKAIARLIKIHHEPFLDELAKASLEYDHARRQMMQCEASYCGIGVRRRDELLVEGEEAVKSHHARRTTGHNVGNAKADKQRQTHGGTIEELRPIVTEKFAKYTKSNETRPLLHACTEAAREDGKKKIEQGKKAFSERSVYNYFRKYPLIM
jgi:hypothetical protein